MTYDINILGDLADSQPDLRMDGTFLTGAAKLAQKFMILLLTDVETDPFGRGTRIPTLRRSLANSDMAFIDGVFRIACGDVKDQLATTYTEDTPSDERMSSYDVQTEKVEADWTQIRIIITTAAGEELTLVLPKTLQEVQEA